MINSSKNNSRPFHSPEKPETFSEKMPLSYQSLDTGGRLIDVNHAWLSLLGYGREDVIGKWFGDFLSQESRERFRKDFPLFKAAGEFKGLEFVMVKKDGACISVSLDGKIDYDKKGKFLRAYCVLQDITERKRAEEVFKYRLEFKKLITDISLELINLAVEEIDSRIEQTLKAIGEFTSVDRSYVFMFSGDKKKMDNTHEWCAEGIEPLKEERTGLPASLLPWAMERLRKSEIVHIPQIENLPEEAAAEKIILKSQSIQSVIIVPMIYRGSLAGFFGLDSIRMEKRWPEEIISLLGIAGKIIINSLESKWADEALKESEDRYRRMVEAITSYTYSVQIGEGRFITTHSPGCLAVTGYKPEDYQSDPNLWYSKIYPEDREKVRRQLARAIAGEDVPPIEHRIVHSNSSIRWVRNTIVLFRNKANEILRYNGLIEDITERKQAEEALLQTELEKRMILDSISAIITFCDKDMKIKWANRAATESAGTTFNKMIGQFCYRVFEDSHELCDNCQAEKAFETGKPQETEVTSQDGNRTWVCVCHPVLDNNQVTLGLVNVIQDVTTFRQLEAERNKASKLESIGVLAGGIAHDFNNILTAVLGNISLAMLYTDSEEELSQVLAEAEKAGCRAKDLTRQLITFSRGGAPIRKMVSMAELIKDAAGFALRGSNVDCRFSIQDDLWSAEVDEGQIKQVINNLVLNADDAMQDGGIVDVRAENIYAGPDEDSPLDERFYIKIIVEDRGAGILRGNLTKIFDPYFTTKALGSGLGLAAAYSIVKRHGGRITVESEPGLGSVFSVYLPAVYEGVEDEKLKKKEEDMAQTITRGGKVMIIDDEDIVREATGKMLDHLGYEVGYAADGAEALELYEREKKAGRPFDAVIIDLTIPGGMGGKETIKKLLEFDKDAKGIVSSGYSNDTVLANFRHYGFIGAVSKPFSITELKRTLNKVIQEKDGR
ncbi:MAG: PAS domain S-box protein [Gemmatimonadota bacterium]|nr:PAS domain S-box protein [Gemmatimonadota bacterium]